VDIVGKLGETRKMGAGYIVWQEVFDNNVKVVTVCDLSFFASVKAKDAMCNAVGDVCLSVCL